MADQTIDGNNRSNIIVSGATDDEINAGGGHDLVISGAGDDTVNGGAGRDIIISGSGDDTVNGGSGSDILITGEGNDTVDGGSGNDIIISGSGDDTIEGGAGNDLILSGSGDDIVSGGSGNDTIDSGSGDDTVSGGSGHDSIQTGAGNDTATGDEGHDVILTGSGDDVASGNAGHDVIITGSGADTVYGNAGNDVIVTCEGDDVVDGGSGHDVILAGDGNDTVVGGSGDDVVLGGYGNDSIKGDEGRDWIHAGAGDDILEGGSGNDYLNGGSEFDIAVFSGQYSDYTIQYVAENEFQVTHNATGDVDTVKNVEVFRFDDRDLDPNSPSNADPIAADDAAITNEDTAVTINVLSNDSDSDGDTLTVTTASAINGSVSINVDGTLEYTPNANFNGTDTVSYEIADGNGGTSTASVTVTVNAVNDGPVAADDSASTNEDTVVTIDVLGNDSDVDGDTLSVTSASAANGSVTINVDGTLDYTPNANFNGTDTISYEIADGNGGTSSASVTVTVNAVNDGPVAADDAAITNEDTAVNIDVLSNDSDIDGDTLSVTSASASNGSVSINVDGTLEYTPNANFNGTDTISYEIADGNGGTSSASVTVTVNAVNDGPVAADDSASTNEDTAVTIDVLSNDSDVDGDTLSVTSASATNGSVSINVDGTLEYTPNANFNGTDTVSYEIADGNGGTSSASVTVTVNAVNDGPVAADDSASTNEDTAVTIDVLSNDSDVDGDTLSVTSASATNGSVSINVDGTLEYTPNANFNGTDTVSYEIADGNGGTSSASVTITVNAVNDGPLAADDAAITNEDTAVNIDVLSNDSDIDGDSLAVTSATATNGSVTINVDGTLDYTPNANFNGTDTVSYEIADGNGGTSSASVTITVNAVNDGPLAADDAAITNEDTAVNIDVLSNDSDIDGDNLTVTSASATNGSVTINVDGTLDYTPNANFNGTDTVSYEIADGNGGTSTASVTVTVNAVNDGPVAADDSASTNEDTAVTIDVLSNDSDVDGDTLSVTVASATNGSVTINVDGTLEYTPNANFNGTDTISYEIADGNGGTSTASVAVTVNAVNDGPVAAGDAISANEDTSVTIDVLSNDSDIDGDTLSVTSASAANGSVSINVDGTLDYTPDSNFNGTDTISYEIADGNGGTSSATVTVTVNAVNDGPVAADDAATTNEDTPVTIDVLSNDSDIDGDTLSVTSASASNGSVSINVDGTLEYTPNATFNGTDTISYEVSDGNGGIDTASVTVVVNAINDAPIAVNDSVSTDEDTAVTIDVLGNDSDVDGDVLSVISASATNGSVNINVDGTLEYTPNANFNGTDTISYEIADGNGGTSSASVTVTVNAVNDGPVAADDAISTDSDTAVTIDVLNNDSDIEGDSLSVTSATASNGTVSINVDGSLNYIANADFVGTDTINYEITDGNGGTAAASVIVTVSAGNVDPVASDESVTFDEDQVISINVLANDRDVDGDPLAVTSASAENGVVVINPNGTLSYTPNANFNGADTISYEISDGRGGTSTANVSVTVNAVNDNPTLQRDTVMTNVNAAIIIDALANDSDVDGDALTITSASAFNGTVIIDENGLLVYTPNEGFDGTDSIIYEVSDGQGGSSTATVDVLVNNQPLAQDDTVTTNEETAVTFDVLANDSDIDGDELSVASASATNGTVDINADGTLTYTPSAEFNGTDVISYEVSDGNGGTSTASVTVTVNAENDEPVSNNDAVSVNADSSVIIDVLENDTDADGDTLSVTSATAANGTVVINVDGTLTYTPNANFYGSDSISYEVSDGNGGTSAAIVDVSVNSQPLAVSDTVNTDEDTAVMIDVLANDSDLDGDTLFVTTASAANGTVVLNGEGTLTYIPDANFNGSDTISYEVADGNGGTSSASVAVTVNAVNDAPVTENDSVTTNEDTAVSIDVLSNDYDIEGDSLTVTQASAANGTVTIDAQGMLIYTPSSGFRGIDTVSYEVEDGQGGSSTASVSVSVVNPLNEAPNAVNDVSATNEDSFVVIDVLANDTDPDADPIEVTSATAANGTVSINSDGTLTYTPNADFNGSDIISYNISDGQGGTSSATVAVSVSAVNDNPLAINNVAVTDEDTAITIDVLVNDSDVEGDSLTVTSATAVNGIVSVNGDGTLSYTPNAGFAGNDTISYEISDGNGGTDTASVAVTVNAVNDAPVASDDVTSTNEDTTVIIDVLANDSDLDGDSLSVTSATASNGTVTINVDGTLSYTPNADFNGTDIINYEITDGNGGSAAAIATVAVDAVNDYPVAVNDSFVTDLNVSATIDVLANDTDIEGNELSVVSATAQNGSVSINVDGTLTYTPATDFNGVDQISYEISDGQGGVSTATADITVNTPPIAGNDTVTTNEDTSVIIDVLSNDSDLDGNSLAIVSATAPNGTVLINLDGTLTYTPNANFYGSDNISYTITDGYGGVSSAEVAVTILPVNIAPVAVDDAYTTNESSTITINVLENDSDLDNNVLTVDSATALNGTVTTNPDNSLSYTPNANFNGVDSISYEISDGRGGVSSATAYITVNTQPDAVNDVVTVDAGSNGSIASLEQIYSNGQVIAVDDSRLVANDTDGEAQTLTITQVNGQDLVNGSITIAGSNGGIFTVDADGTASFDASTGYENLAEGESALTEVVYTVTDGHGGFDTATVQVVVNGQSDDAVRAQADLISADENSVITLDVLANDDVFIDGDVASVTAVNGTAANIGVAVTGSQGGLFTLNADGSASFDANQAFDYLTDGEVVTTSVTYTIQGFGGETSTSTVDVQVSGSNNAPVANDDFATVDAGSNGDIANLIAIYVNGQVIVTGDERLVANDTDAEGQTLTVTQVNGQDLVNGSITIAGSNGGVFTVDADGTASFDASTGYESLAEGESALTELVYTITDGQGGFDTATVQVTVNGQNDAVQAQADLLTADESSVIMLDVLANDAVLIDGDVANVSAVNGTVANVGVAVTGSQGGLFTLNADGSASFDANQAFDHLTDGEVVTTSVTYTIEGFGGETSTSTVEVQVSGSNNAPVAEDDFASVEAGTNSDIANLKLIYVNGQVIVTGDNRLVSNDADAEGQDLIITQVNGQDLVNGSITIAGSNGGVFTVNADGAASFDATTGYESLMPGESALTELVYTISDGNGGFDTATLQVTINGRNDAPEATSDTATVDEDSSVIIDVLANDTDINGGELFVASASAANGVVVINADNTITYTPNANFNGSDTINYIVSDGDKTDASTVAVTVTPINDAPDAQNDAINIDSSQTVIIDVLLNDIDVDEDVLTVTAASAANGNVTINPDGTLSYTADNNATGLDTISYEVSDGNGGVSSASVTVNRNPTAIDDYAETQVDNPVSVNVLSNDIDLDGDSLTVTNASALNGNVLINNDGTLLYTPNSGYIGSDTITYQVTDVNGGLSTAVVNIDVGESVNNPPVAGDDFATVDAGSDGYIANLKTIYVNGQVIVTGDNRLTTNDTDAEGQDLTITQVNGQDLVNGSIVVTGSNGGVFTVDADGTARFDASTGFESVAVGESALTELVYTITDGFGGIDTATVQVTVNGQNDAVQAESDLLSAEESSVITLDVLANDVTFVDGDVANVSAVNGTAANVGLAVTGSQGGLFTLNADGSATFDANQAFDYLTEGEVVTTSVTYTIEGFGGETSTSTVEVQVSGSNTDPVANDDFATVNAGSNSSIANLRVIYVGGQVIVTGDNRLVSNDADAEGQDLIITQVNGVDLVNGSITVAGSNGGFFTVAEDGVASFDATSGYESVPAGGHTTSELTYTISDGNGGTDTAIVTVTIKGTNVNTIASDDSASTTESESVVIDVLANDADENGQTLAITSIDTSGLTGGIVVDNGDGTLTFDPNGQFDSLNDGEFATEWFEYTVEDGLGGLDTAQVQLTIMGQSTANEAPVAEGESAQPPVDEGTTPPDETIA